MWCVQRSKKIGLIVLVLGIGIFGYSQYAFASQIGVTITESEFLEETNRGSIYNVQLEFDNPSLLMLTAGETDFVVSVDNKVVADGTLEPFVLPALNKVTVHGTFMSNSDSSDSESTEIKISGVTKYDIFFTSIDVPFVYYPTADQASEFIHQN